MIAAALLAIVESSEAGLQTSATASSDGAEALRHLVGLGVRGGLEAVLRAGEGETMSAWTKRLRHANRYLRARVYLSVLVHLCRGLSYDAHALAGKGAVQGTSLASELPRYASGRVSEMVEADLTAARARGRGLARGHMKPMKEKEQDEDEEDDEDESIRLRYLLSELTKAAERRLCDACVCALDYQPQARQGVAELLGAYLNTARLVLFPFVSSR